ncbi:MAG: hypothetical protein RLZZ597_1894 [Cyanobacteriota bacterium]|jgi:hypothetical protein
MPDFRAGQIIPLRYKSREIQVIIIDPNGLGPDKPSIGLGLRGMDRHIGIPRQTLSDRVSEIDAEDGNRYLLVEASDWVALAQD